MAETQTNFNIEQQSSDQLSISTAVHGGTTSKVNLTGSGIGGGADQYWDFRFTYTLT